MHLTPDAILILASFAHLCESYLGILSIADLLRFFFLLDRSVSNSSNILGTCSFRLRDNRIEELLEIPPFHAWEAQSSRWIIAGGMEGVLPFVDEPAVETEFWTVEPGEPQLFLHCRDAVVSLRSRGLTLGHVVEDFLTRKLLPLKLRVDPSWVHHYGKDPSQEKEGRTSVRRYDNSSSDRPF